MAASGAWTQIEAAAPQPRSSRSPSADAGATPDPSARGAGRGVSARLRRHGRPILGALDGGGVALRRMAGPAILGTAVFVVPVMAINLLVTRAAFDHFETLDGNVISAAQLFTGIDAATGVETLVTYLSLIATSLSVSLAGAYLALLLVRRSLGQPDDPLRCLRSVLRRLPVLVLGWALAHSWMLLADLIAARASLSDLAPTVTFSAPLVVWLVGLTALVSPVIVSERLGPWRGVRRALQLARARGGAVFGFSCICVLLGGGLRLSIAALPRLIEETGLIGFGSSGWLAEGLAAQIAQLIVVPFIGLSTAALYLQVRMDAEGLDLVLEAERAFA